MAISGERYSVGYWVSSPNTPPPLIAMMNGGGIMWQKLMEAHLCVEYVISRKGLMVPGFKAKHVL